jgi:outer membrane lipoprotein-sorting protein
MRLPNAIPAIAALSLLWVLSSTGFSQTNTSPATIQAPSGIPTPTLATRLTTLYSRIKSVSCDIRKTTKGDGRTLRMLSRVHYSAPHHIHVDNVSPAKRTIIADGERLYYYEAGMKRGFSKPISELSEKWLAPLRNIPGTAMEHLYRLRDCAEIQLEPSPEGYLRRAYQTDNVFVVLSADRDDRLHRIDFFADSTMLKRTGEYIYTQFEEVIDGCWIPMHHRATLFLPADEVAVEIRSIRNLAANGTIPKHLFDHELFMKDIDFVDTFNQIYQ